DRYGSPADARGRATTAPARFARVALGSARPAVVRPGARESAAGTLWLQRRRGDLALLHHERDLPLVLPDPMLRTRRPAKRTGAPGRQPRLTRPGVGRREHRDGVPPRRRATPSGPRHGGASVDGTAHSGACGTPDRCSGWYASVLHQLAERR